MTAERELVAEIRSYLMEHFPHQEITEEWDRSRDVLVLRIPSPAEDGRTFLVEVASDFLDNAAPEEIRHTLDRWNLKDSVRSRFRVLLTPNGLEPLPWKQLAPEHDRLEEALEETFPASDPPAFPR